MNLISNDCISLYVFILILLLLGCFVILLFEHVDKNHCLNIQYRIMCIEQIQR